MARRKGPEDGNENGKEPIEPAAKVIPLHPDIDRVATDTKAFAADTAGQVFAPEDREADIKKLNLYGYELLRSGEVEKFHILRKDNSGWNPDFSGKNFSGAKLPYANLDKAIISGADFSGADLYSTNLDNIIAIKTIFAGANLTGAVGQGGMFLGADFTETNIADGLFSDADFSSVKFIRTNFEDAHFLGCTFMGTDFSGAKLEFADFSDSVFIEPKALHPEELYKANFHGTALPQKLAEDTLEFLRESLMPEVEEEPD